MVLTVVPLPVCTIPDQTNECGVTHTVSGATDKTGTNNSCFIVCLFVAFSHLLTNKKKYQIKQTNQKSTAGFSA